MQAQTSPAGRRVIIELRYFHMRNGRQVERTTNYLRRGLLPAFERAGVGPAGCFSSVIGPESPFILTVASHASLASLETAREKLAADKELLAADDEYNSMSELSYIRMESSLLLAFPAMPTIVPPPARENHAAHLFELRTYETPNDTALARKVKMFGDGQTIVGSHMPNLTYMLAYDDLATRDKVWRAFSADPDWQKLRVTPGLTDAEIVSNISNMILQPLPFSPIR
jgi:hypothetical protein